MWKRKELKGKARGALRRNYWSIVILCVIVGVVMGSFVNPVSRLEQMRSSAQDSLSYINESGEYIFPEETTGAQESQASLPGLAANAKTGEMSNTDIVDAFLGGAGMEDERAKRWTGGVLSVFVNNAEGAGSVIYGVMNTINQTVFGDRINAGAVIALGTLIQLLIFLLVKNVVQVSCARFMLETRAYSGTRISKLLFPWRIKRGEKIARIMLVKTLYLFFWRMTVVGGIIKTYSYRMVPYIAAENPELGARETLSLSRKMMDGNKWRAFVLDCSFLLWRFLDFLTFGLVGIFFLEPYRELTNAELYMWLREKADPEKLCDRLLDAKPAGGEYPAERYILPVAESRKWLRADYDRHYSLTSLILIFFAFSFAGWAWEVSLHLFKDGVFVNRGVSYGPWLPIYGAGGVLVLVVLQKFRRKPALTFVLTMLLCGVVEYGTSYFLEVTHGMKWWDYSGYFMNLNGRICLEGLLVFALGGCAAVYLIAPALDDLFNRMPQKVKITLCALLVTLFVCDQVYSGFYPNSGKGITDYQ